jgi:protein-tyrosine phosphatase
VQSYSREINFDAIVNFRDLGGYRAKDNSTVVWRQLFRSGYLHPMTERDLTRLKEEIKLNSVIDLRSDKELQQLKEVSLLNDVGIKYFNVPFISYPKEELHHDFSNMGEAYLFRIRHKEYSKSIIDAMEIIADPKNHPLLFHCGAGKDRSGLVAAFVLSVLGVADGDIIADYILSAPYMKDLITRFMNEIGTPEDIINLPAYTWKATSESMTWFLTSLKHEFGSARGYLEMHGAETSLFDRLEKALLI